jgi:AraC family transcriptional regulator, regulatory protein of adaptative response / methylated-DNA-[protein]-cysteine methyltransferase
MATQTIQSLRQSENGQQAMHDLSPEWKTIVERSTRFDGIIYYGVRSTGIYCKPSCPSRKPRPENVRLFFAPAEAERAGFRACKRCRPEQAAQSDEQVEVVRAVCRHVENNLEGSLNLRKLGHKAGFDPTHFHKAFKRVTGITPRQFVEARRLSAFKRELRSKSSDVTGAIYKVGYGSSSRIYERAASQLGMTPATYRKGAPGVHIRYATADSPLGRVLLAATDKGICSVKIGDSDSVLLDEFRAEFPKAQAERDDLSLKDWLRAIIADFDGKDESLALPIDIQLTAFQSRVYDALRRIPRGETRTYAQLATELTGTPTACRAVARACATNPVAVAIPCHRVIGSNGSLTGYRWGVDRKKKLLETEKDGAPGSRSRPGAFSFRPQKKARPKPGL